MISAHQIALDPTMKQRNLFARAAGCARFAYNWGIDEWEIQYKTGLKPSAYKVRNKFNAIKGEEFPWMYDSPAGGTNQAFLDLGAGYNSWFKGLKGQGPKVGHPKKHKKGKNDGFYVLADRIRFEGKSVILPVMGKVKLHLEWAQQQYREAYRSLSNKTARLNRYQKELAKLEGKPVPS